MAEPSVRLYDAERDFDDCIHVFRTTADVSVSREPAITIGSFIWCRPYLLLSPSTCFVLDDGNGRVVGYIIGTSSTVDFMASWRLRFAPFVDKNAVARPENHAPDGLKWMRKAVYEADCSMLANLPLLLSQYPGHFHIDILPEFTGRGYGRRMMEIFLSKLKELGVHGLHLGMVRSNEGARKFYERLGFDLCDQVLDDGESGELGRAGDAVCFLKKL
ncbi:GCN5-related N-acetyltransferas-like protein [Polyplosphaeria fusca]|uniref:GCN5-related N-acetyltransferas-like protein n=1 Tax=Polyplosphaeria fusca TaxID=682080 RepID=A0A9P4R9U2_9PLEO|nr:GCN5-related N-acetyltransferas-like protein [Polyplosphaeria fusca]